MKFSPNVNQLLPKNYTVAVSFSNVLRYFQKLSATDGVLPICFKEQVYNFLYKINPNVGVVSRQLSRARRCNLNMNLLMESVIELMQYNIAL